MEPAVTDLLALDQLAPELAHVMGDTRWLDVQADLISGGKSNLTFTLTSPAGELILRRPPTGSLLPSAHDMGREARVQRALATTDVPVAHVVLYDRGRLLGVPCYVMQRVRGHVVRSELPTAYAETRAERQALAYTFVDTLAALHTVDPELVGLGDYGRPQGFLERQVHRWIDQWVASRTHQVAEIDELGRRLASTVPAPERASIVHGDFRLDNVVFDLDKPDRIRAVLDWELSSLGDPLTDVGLLMLFWREPGEATISLIPGVTHLDGFPDRAALRERYATHTGADLGCLAFYEAFAHFKFAVIAQGVSARAKAGAMGGQTFGNLDDEIRELGRAGLCRI